MTQLAYDVLGTVVPRLDAFVSITGPPAEEGILITRQPGVPLAELWPSLSSAQRTAVKISLAALLVRMRAARERFDYYGRPGEKPYITPSEFGPNDLHAFCRTRSDWDESRVRALSSACPDVDLPEDSVRALERVQHETGAGGATLVDSPVLTHTDLSDRNILIEPTTLEVTGFIDWELAIVAPAYFEYAAACLSGGHQPEWRKELLEILREVLRIECEREVVRTDRATGSQLKERGINDLFKETLAAWNALVNVERPAQGYSDDCSWTFEHEVRASSAAEETNGTEVDEMRS